MTFDLTQQEIQLIANILVEQPFKVVAGLIAKLEQQLAVQREPQSARVPDAVDKRATIPAETTTE